MADDDTARQNFSVSVPLGVLAAGVIVGLAAAAAYVISIQGNGETTTMPRGAAKKGKGMGRRFALLSLVTLIENDTTRKAVVAVLRAIAKRS